jgi:hypothetical protein
MRHPLSISGFLKRSTSSGEGFGPSTDVPVVVICHSRGWSWLGLE